MKSPKQKEIDDIFALTPMQEAILFRYLKNPESDVYFEQLCLDITGIIDNKHFEQAWDFVVTVNEMLRVVFHWEKIAVAVQVILKEKRPRITYYDFSKKDENERKRLVEEIKRNDKNKKFDLRQVPFRIILCKVVDKKYLMIISNHHIIYDGWSNGILLKEFLNAYTDLTHGKTPIPPVKYKFKKFVKWGQEQDIKEQEKFWSKYLSGYNISSAPPIELLKKTRKGTPLKGSYPIHLHKNMEDKLENFVREYKVTLASLLYSAWGLLLQKYSGRKDVLFYTTVSGRTVKIKGIENIVGLFINTLPYRVQTHEGERIDELLIAIEKMSQEREKYELTGLANIKEFSNIYKDNLFNSIIVIENYPLDHIILQKNQLLSINSYSIDEINNYDLMVLITLFNGIEMRFTYDMDVFEKDFVIKLSHHFTLILQEIQNKESWRLQKINGIKDETFPDPHY